MIVKIQKSLQRLRFDEKIPALTATEYLRELLWSER